MKNVKWRYALGEILIVILGISIAFSMNKYAEEKRDKKLKNQYVESLIGDLEADKEQLVQITSSMRQKLETISPLLSKLNSDLPEKQKLIKNIMSGAIIYQFIPSKATYNTLVNSGDLKLIENIELKKEIDDHYSKQYELLKNANDRVENINKKYLADYFIYEGLSSISFNAKEAFNFKNESLLKEIYNSTFYAVKFKIGVAESTQKSCEDLIQKLKEESE